MYSFHCKCCNYGRGRFVEIVVFPSPGSTRGGLRCRSLAPSRRVPCGVSGETHFTVQRNRLWCMPPPCYKPSSFHCFTPLKCNGQILVVAYALKSGVRVLIASGWNANPQLAKVGMDIVDET